MLREAFSLKIGTSAKSVIANIVLVASAFLWYFHIFNFLSRQLSASDALIVWGVNFVGIVISAVFGVALARRFNSRTTFLSYWMGAGIFVSFVPLMIDVTGTMELVVVSAVLGGYFGLGMPACMGHFSASTNAENRARIGGITFFCIGLGVFLLGTLVTTDITLNALILAAIRAVGYLIFSFSKIKDSSIGKKAEISYMRILTHKPFLLYFVPWCIFSLINYMAAPVVSKSFGEEFVLQSTIIEFVLIGIFAVVSGCLADYFGRKRLTIAGFAMLGIGYAILSLSPSNVNSWWFYTIIDGIAWGSFYTIFLITLWGDLAIDQKSEKYYTIGALPYLVSNFMRLWLGSYIADVVEVNTVFSFAAFFLFLAVLPLVYAPETLPEKIVKERELKNYIAKAEKEARKNKTNDTEDAQRKNIAVELDFETKDFEEVQEELEKTK